MYVTDISALVDTDIELMKKECQELDNLLIPACEIKLMIVLGEGMYMQLIIIAFSYYWVYLGQFGKVYKGMWQHKSDIEDAVSQVVAVKTIKSKYTYKFKSKSRDWSLSQRVGILL